MSQVPPELQRLSNSLGLGKYRRHIFLCADQTEPKCCSKEQGLASWNYLKERLAELKLVGPQPLVYLYESELPADLRLWAGGGGLSGGHLVPLLHPRSD